MKNLRNLTMLYLALTTAGTGTAVPLHYPSMSTTTSLWYSNGGINCDRLAYYFNIPFSFLPRKSAIGSQILFRSLSEYQEDLGEHFTTQLTLMTKRRGGSWLDVGGGSGLAAWEFVLRHPAPKNLRINIVTIDDVVGRVLANEGLRNGTIGLRAAKKLLYGSVNENTHASLPAMQKFVSNAHSKMVQAKATGADLKYIVGNIHDPVLEKGSKFQLISDEVAAFTYERDKKLSLILRYWDLLENHGIAIIKYMKKFEVWLGESDGNPVITDFQSLVKEQNIPGFFIDKDTRLVISKRDKKQKEAIASFLQHFRFIREIPSHTLPKYHIFEYTGPLKHDFRNK